MVSRKSDVPRHAKRHASDAELRAFFFVWLILSIDSVFLLGNYLVLGKVARFELSRSLIWILTIVDSTCSSSLAIILIN